MPRASTIKRLPPEQRQYLEKLIREDRHTLDEILALVRERFPAAKTPSRSALGRYSQQVGELAGRMRDIQAAGMALVSELGEDPSDRAGQLLVNAVTSLATHAALQANDPDAKALNIKEVGALARAAHATMQTRKMSLAERQEVDRLARERQLAEQAERLQATVKAGGLSATAAETIRKQILGLA